jgi:hypothetical protein
MVADVFRVTHLSNSPGKIMRKALLPAATAALLLSTAALQPARADGGATAAIIIGAATLTTLGCYSTGAPPLCILSPVYWVGAIVRPVGNVIVEPVKKKKKK